MLEKEKTKTEELEKIAGGEIGKIKPKELFKGLVSIKHDENGDYSERVCNHCGKTFRCDEYMYMGRMTPEQASAHEYYRSTCPECRKTHPFEFSY